MILHICTQIHICIYCIRIHTQIYAILHLQTWHLQTEAFGDAFPVVVAKSQLHFQSYNYIIYLHIIYNLLHMHRITCHINWCGMSFILQQFPLQNLVLGFLPGRNCCSKSSRGPRICLAGLIYGRLSMRRGSKYGDLDRRQSNLCRF